MAQLFRDQFQHYVNTATINGATENPTYTREGQGVESLSVAFNPQKNTYKDITRRTASDKRCYDTDPMYDYLYDLKKRAISAETQLVEVNTAKTNGTAGNYDATRYDILITINEWLGENATISYDIDYTNPVQGIATISNGTITFTESASV